MCGVTRVTVALRAAPSFRPGGRRREPLTLRSIRYGEVGVRERLAGHTADHGDLRWISLYLVDYTPESPHRRERIVAPAADHGYLGWISLYLIVYCMWGSRLPSTFTQLTVDHGYLILPSILNGIWHMARSIGWLWINGYNCHVSHPVYLVFLDVSVTVSGSMGKIWVCKPRIVTLFPLCDPVWAVFCPFRTFFLFVAALGTLVY